MIIPILKQPTFNSAECYTMLGTFVLLGFNVLGLENLKLGYLGPLILSENYSYYTFYVKNRLLY